MDRPELKVLTCNSCGQAFTAPVDQTKHICHICTLGDCLDGFCFVDETGSESELHSMQLPFFNPVRDQQEKRKRTMRGWKDWAAKKALQTPADNNDNN